MTRSGICQKCDECWIVLDFGLQISCRVFDQFDLIMPYKLVHLRRMPDPRTDSHKKGYPPSAFVVI